MRWAGHVARMGKGRGVYRVLVGKLEGKRPEPGLDGMIILDGSSGSGMWGYGKDRAGSKLGQVEGTCECGNEPSGSVKCGEIIDKLRTI